MNKGSVRDCSAYIKSLKCKSCKRYKKMLIKENKKYIKAQLKNKTYKTSKKTIKESFKCEKCKYTNTKKCNLKDYMSFSGAELGKCGKSFRK
jgi:transcription elongation factor Elf1